MGGIYANPCLCKESSLETVDIGVAAQPSEIFVQLLLLLFTFDRGSKRVVKTNEFPVAQRGLSVEMYWRSPPRRWRHQIPTHKRKRGGGSFLLFRFSLANAVKLTMKTTVHVRKNVL